MGCIYLYTNKINGMQYIGQTTRDIKTRHWQHLSQKETYFDRALQKYGKDNFELTILEDNIFDVDELNKKEEYYIEKYDTFNSGYNMTRGGENRTRFSEEDRDKITSLIISTNFPFTEIGKQTGYSVYTVSDINQGKLLPKEGYKYPLREKRCSEHFTQEDIDNVIALLKETNFSFEKIAELTETNFYFVADINRGKRSFLSSEIFPIRQTVKRAKVSKELAVTIISLLKENDKSAEEIGKLLGIPGYTVGSINRGTHSICRQIQEDYPIRKKQYKTKRNRGSTEMSDENIEEIIELLINTNLNLEEIGKRYGVDRSAISRINRGVSFKYITDKYKKPIRQNKDYNLHIGDMKE